jgi:hypothetical protein
MVVVQLNWLFFFLDDFAPFFVWEPLLTRQNDGGAVLAYRLTPNFARPHTVSTYRAIVSKQLAPKLVQRGVVKSLASSSPDNRPHCYSQVFFCSSRILGASQLIFSPHPTRRSRKSSLHRILTKLAWLTLRWPQ